MLSSRRAATSTTALILLLLCNDAGADVELGVAAYQRGDFATALAEFSDAAGRNDPLALNVLGIMYAEGRAIERNDKVAVDLFFRAQALGSLEAGANLGRMYATGRGVAQSNSEALKHFRDAAMGGYVPAMRRLAEIYEKGELGVSPDPAMASEWRSRLGGTPTGLMQLRPAPPAPAVPRDTLRETRTERKPLATPAPAPASREATGAAQDDKHEKFERQVLAQLEKYRQRERKLQVASTDTTPALATYLKDLRARLKQQLHDTLPASTWRAGMTVSLVILKDGTLKGIEIDRGSGDARLDRNVLASLKQLGHLPPLPATVHDTADVLGVTIRLPID